MISKNLPFHEEINHLYLILSNQNWWHFKLRPVSSGQYALTILIATITVLLYVILGTPKCEVQELKKGKHSEPEAYRVTYPYEYNFILDHPEKCQHKPFLVIMVPSAPTDVMERQAVRNTWAAQELVQEKHVVVLFLIGSPSGGNKEVQQARLYQENTRHNDVLQSNFIDSRQNATIKTMVMLEWLRDHCSQAYYAAKVDTDILFNVRSLIRMLLESHIPQRNYITGQVTHNNTALRTPQSRYYIPFEMYPKSVFPPYPLAKCYVMSLDLPAKILKASKKIKPILKDDLYIGLCLDRLGIAPRQPPNPSQFVFSPPETYDRCYYSELIAVIIHTPAQMVNFWTDIYKMGAACSPFNKEEY